MKTFFFTFRLKRSKYCRQDKCTGNGSKVTSWYFAQKCQEPHQHKKKMELFIRLTFQTPSYWFLLENSLLATANRTTNKLAWSELCFEKIHSAFRRPTEMECTKWAQLLLSYESRQWSKGGRAWTLQSEELAFTIKKLSCSHICTESSITTPKNTHTAKHLKAGNRFNGWN